MRNRRIVLAWAILLGCLTAAGEAVAGEIVVACAHEKSGKLRIVADAAQCRANERIVVWAVRGPEGPAGPEGPEGPAGPPGESAPSFDAVDAEGIRLGEFLGWPFGQNVLVVAAWRADLGVIINHSQEDEDVVHSCGQFLYFEEPGCSGAGWIPSQCHRRLIGPFLGEDRFVAATEPPLTAIVQFQSRILRPFDTWQNVSGTAGGPGLFDPAGFAPLREISMDDLGFSLPLTPPLYLVPRAD